MRRDRLVALLLVLVTLAVYAQTAGFGFVNYDDPVWVYNNPMVRQGLTAQAARWSFTTGEQSNWVPLTWLSHMLDVQLFGVSRPGAHHLVNVLLHLANTVALFYLLRKTTRTLWPSAFVAAMFALHPLHVESVAWVTERKDVLSTLLGLGAIGAYVGYTQKRSLWRYLLCGLLMALSLMAKPMLVTLPFVLLLLDYWPLGRLAPLTFGRLRILLLEKIPLLALAAAFSAVTYQVQRAGGAMTVPLSRGGRLANALVAYALYLRKTVWPSDLAAFYPHPFRPGCPGVSVLALLASTSLMVGLTLAALWATRRWNARYLIVGWLWFLGTLVPTIGLVQVGSQAMADRYTYVPLIGLFMMVAFGVADLVRARILQPTLSAIAAVVVLLASMIVTTRQVSTWRNTDTMASHALQVTKPDWHMEVALAQASFSDQRFDQAISHYRKALTFQPLLPEANLGLGVIYQQRGQYEPSIRHLLTAASVMPNDHDVLYSLAVSLNAVGRRAEAVTCLNRCLELYPNDALAHNLLATTYDQEGLTASAVTHYRRAVELAPDRYEILNNYAWLLATHSDDSVRDGKLALLLADRAVKLALQEHQRRPNPSAVVATLTTLAAAAAEDGRFDLAIAASRKVLELAGGQPALTDATRQRLALYESGRAFHRQPNSTASQPVDSQPATTP